MDPSPAAPHYDPPTTVSERMEGRRVRRWLAVALSLVAPGLGQVYCRTFARAGVFLGLGSARLRGG